jgi:hypothetical protein
MDSLYPAAMTLRLALALVLALATAAHAQAASLSVDDVRARLSDRTTIAGEGPDRWQVEYTAPDGVVYQWQPGVAVLAGRWSVRDYRGQTEVCFTYPVELVIPGEEKCGDAAYPLGLKGKVALESRPGDVFGLATGKAPRETGGKPAWPE